MTPEDYWYLPPDPPTTERRCPAEEPSDSPWDPDQCGHPTETAPEPLGAADHAELDATATLDDLFTTDDDPEFFDYITAMAESIAV